MLIAPLTEEILSSSSAISTGARVLSVSLDFVKKKPSETIAISLGIGVVWILVIL